MRITNQMIQNNSLNNIAVNKKQMSTLDTQLSTQKKISRPSEDPIVAIRALRLRTSLDEVSQYLDKNIPDASSWLDVTEGALTEVDSILSDVYQYCVQGSTDTLALSERKIIRDSIEELREAIYSQGDVDYAGRYVFTGFRTNDSLTFQTEEDLADGDYTITQEFDANAFDFKDVTEGTNALDQMISRVQTEGDTFVQTLTTGGIQDVSNDVVSNQVHRLRLAYTDISQDNFEIYDGNGNPISYAFQTSSSQVPGDNEVLLNANTGELLFGQAVYEDVMNSLATEGNKISITYDKDTFVQGDVKPEHYFNCVQTKADGTQLTYTNTEEGQDISYIVNFNQKLKVNSEAKDVLTTDIGRDIDDIFEAVDRSIASEERLTSLKELKDNPNYSDDTSQANLDALIAAAEKELAYYNDTLQKTFEAGITKMQNHQEAIDIGIADIGNRMKRLELTETRLKEQKTNFTELKSNNEDIDLEEIVIDYSSAELVYNSSLTAASKVVRQTLLDFI
ncbi:MAG: flagellar hook-associated protein FlgL [Lachnospiraceae bacterium]|nr:flagellar hook-associated protein FlgL [Lachnospiraceae bacterium]